MTRCINLRSHEALAAVQKRLTCLVRPMKPQPWVEQCYYGPTLIWSPRASVAATGMQNVTDQPHPDWLHHCPLGVSGDMLTGRETWKCAPAPDCTYGEMMRASNMLVTYRVGGGEKHLHGGHASGPDFHIDFGGEASEYPMKHWDLWRSAAVMPRWAARHYFVVENVRTLRMLDLTLDECEATGLQLLDNMWGGANLHGMPLVFNDPQLAVASLFNVDVGVMSWVVQIRGEYQDA